MSQDYFSPKSKGKGKGRRRQRSQEEDDEQNYSGQSTAPSAAPSAAPSGRPAYMAVGSGSTSHHATRLQTLIDNDSGYGGSVAGDDFMPGPAASSTPSNSSKFPLGSPRIDPTVNGDMSLLRQSSDPRSQDAAIHQLWYNKHRVTLGRAINQVVELLEGLREMNITWPAIYPSVQRTGLPSPDPAGPRPGIHHTASAAGEYMSPSQRQPRPIQRSMTTIEDAAESSRDAEGKAVSEMPRLFTPQIAQEFSILKLDLKLGSLHQSELVHSLEKSSVAALLDGKISSSVRHLQALRERIEDTASKVLVTGDLNAGKSTFCNALLRRKVLPEDQQPCTSIFCEVLDARENSGVEEVHAVHLNAVYDRHDESTYDVFQLWDLEKIVIDNTNYMQCKVYVKDVRSVDESLLNNGVVDIALIDAPGLNSDTTKTTAVFARQEEIDVVVFVVSAANHFTQSAKEFIWAAASEKAYIFMVVNGYDVIRDKERCQKLILDQVYGLSPRTFKESTELVHFVSSNAIPTSPPGGSGGDGGDDPGNDPKGKGKEKEKIQDFERLEQSLRRFVLEKRARSKLAPARTYLLNILNDVNILATVNSEVAQAELDRIVRELKDLEPQLESSRKAKAEVSDEVDYTIEETCRDIYDYTRATLQSAIAQVGSDADALGVPYPGFFSAFQYAEDVKTAMLSEISASVAACEDHARAQAVAGVAAIKQLGVQHLGDEYHDLSFRPDVMFRRRRDALAKQVDVPTEFWDFVDFAGLVQRQEKLAGTGMALTVATAVGSRVIGGYGWMDHAFTVAKIVGNDNLRRMILPGIVLAAVSVTAYILQQIPHSLPSRLSAKVATQLESLDYVHANSTRISGSVRKVLRIPADSLRVGLQHSFEKLNGRRDETLKTRAESEVALRYFGNLVRSSAKQRAAIEAVDLDAHPGAASNA